MDSSGMKLRKVPSEAFELLARCISSVTSALEKDIDFVLPSLKA